MKVLWKKTLLMLMHTEGVVKGRISLERMVDVLSTGTARMFGLSYSRFMHGLNRADIEIDRKILADLAVHDREAFAQLAEQAKAALAN